MAGNVSRQLAVIAFAAVTYFELAYVLSPWIPLPVVGTVWFTLIVTVFSLAHAGTWLGWRDTTTFFALSALVSWSFEEVGIRTGAVYGAYHYSNMLGTKLGHVPLLIPLAWFMMMYPSYLIAGLITDGRLTAYRDSLGWLLVRAVIAGMVMTAWDLVIDPEMSSAGFWIWEQSGPYFGVPLQNFVGWLATTVTVFLLFGLCQRGIPDAKRTAHIGFGLLPVLVYGVFAVRYALSEKFGPTRIVAVFAMGLPCLIALVRWWDGELAAVAALQTRSRTSSSEGAERGAGWQSRREGSRT